MNIQTEHKKNNKHETITKKITTGQGIPSLAFFAAGLRCFCCFLLPESDDGSVVDFEAISLLLLFFPFVFEWRDFMVVFVCSIFN